MFTNPNQYDIDRQRRNDMMKQAEQDHLASQRATGSRSLYSTALTQLGKTLVSIGHNLQARYSDVQTQPTTETGTFPRIDLA